MIATCDLIRPFTVSGNGFLRDILLSVSTDSIETLSFMERNSVAVGLDVNDILDSIALVRANNEELASFAVDYHQAVLNLQNGLMDHFDGFFGRMRYRQFQDMEGITPDAVYRLGEEIREEAESLNLYEFGELNYYCDGTFRNFLMLSRKKEVLLNEPEIRYEPPPVLRSARGYR